MSVLVNVISGQSLLDLTLQATGDASNLLLIAMANKLVPSDPLPAGLVVVIPDTVKMNTDVVRHYQANGILPATALTEALAVPELTCEEKLYECFKP